MTHPIKIDAGDFDTWLQSILGSFKTGAGMDVPCGECRGCCSAGRFVHLLPSDQAAYSAIPKQFLLRAPGMPQGHAVMGYLDSELCPMLKAGNCSGYSSRPSTCRTFDCRVLAAAGLSMDGKWNERINERVQAWQFTFSSPDGRQRLKAIRDAATFIRQHGAAFPGGRAPTEPTSIAVLAIKVQSVFLSPGVGYDAAKIANAIVTASRRFESEASYSGVANMGDGCKSGLLPLQGEGWDGDGLIAHRREPIPTLPLPLTGREAVASSSPKLSTPE